MQARPVRRRFNIGKIEVLGLGLADFSLPHKGGGSCICSLPPCGGGLGWGGGRTPCLHCTYPPTPPLPHKGGGSFVSPSPTRGEGVVFVPSPLCGGGLGWGVRTPCLHCTYPPTQPSPTRGEGVVFVPSPLWGRELYLFPPPSVGEG